MLLAPQGAAINRPIQKAPPGAHGRASAANSKARLAAQVRKEKKGGPVGRPLARMMRCPLTVPQLQMPSFTHLVPSRSL